MTAQERLQVLVDGLEANGFIDNKEEARSELWGAVAHYGLGERVTKNEPMMSPDLGAEIIEHGEMLIGAMRLAAEFYSLDLPESDEGCVRNIIEQARRWSRPLKPRRGKGRHPSYADWLCIRELCDFYSNMMHERPVVWRSEHKPEQRTPFEALVETFYKVVLEKRPPSEYTIRQIRNHWAK